ncbi:MAG: hypothetical protein ACTSUU_07050, partial [Candidatus Thorarchaeota archaeon]
RIRIEDAQGNPQPADAVFSRMLLNSGYRTLAVVESLPHGPSVVIQFDETATVVPGEEQILSLRVDIDSLASAQSFAIAIPEPSAVRFIDANTGEVVPLDPTVTFPLSTPPCLITNQSKNVAVSYVPLVEDRVNLGQEAVRLLRLILRHDGDEQSSQVQLAALALALRDANGTAIKPSDVFARVDLAVGQTVVGELAISEMDSLEPVILLAAPPVLSPGQSDSIDIRVWISTEYSVNAFRLLIEDSTSITLRDMSSGAIVEAVDDPLVAGSTFPIISSLIDVNLPAQSPDLCIESGLPDEVIAGDDAVDLLTLEFAYAVPPMHSGIEVESLEIGLFDSLDRWLDPTELFDRIGYRINQGSVVYLSTIELDRGYVIFDFPEDIAIEPGGEVAVDLVADIEPDAPYDHFIVSLTCEDAITLRDATDATRLVGVELDDACFEGLPFSTQAVSILMPAGTPLVRINRLPVGIGFPGQPDVTLARASLTYTSSRKGDLLLDRVRGYLFERQPDGLKQINPGDVFATVSLMVGSEIVASTQPGDTYFELVPVEDCVITSGGFVDLSLIASIRDDAPLGNYVVELSDSSWIEFSDRHLLTPIRAGLAGAEYPVTTREFSIVASSLKRSLTNYPNPFRPEDGTTIAYVLNQDAYVDIKIFTITGERVRRLVVNAYREAGSYPEDGGISDVWDGRNDDGRAVLPGTYLLRLTARYASGETEEVLRKVAVIR